MPKGSRNITKYLLVIVDKCSKWPEAFETHKENALTVAKILCKEIIPRWGCPLTIDLDKGTTFTSKILQNIAKLMVINWKFHIPYHPQSLGVVERVNRIIKEKFRKATGGTYVRWEAYLPAVLAEIRVTPSKTTKMSPFEKLMRRPFPTPWTSGPMALMPGDLGLIQEEYGVNPMRLLNSIYSDVLFLFPFLHRNRHICLNQETK